jgi:hypothetical protein
VSCFEGSVCLFVIVIQEELTHCQTCFELLSGVKHGPPTGHWDYLKEEFDEMDRRAAEEAKRRKAQEARRRGATDEDEYQRTPKNAQKMTEEAIRDIHNERMYAERRRQYEAMDKAMDKETEWIDTWGDDNDGI